MHFQHILWKQKLKSKIRLFRMVAFILDTLFRTNSWRWNILLHICNKPYKLFSPSLSVFLTIVWQVLKTTQTDYPDKAKLNIEGEKIVTCRINELYPTPSFSANQLWPTATSQHWEFQPEPSIAVSQREWHISHVAKFSKSP